MLTVFRDHSVTMAVNELYLWPVLKSSRHHLIPQPCDCNLGAWQLACTYKGCSVLWSCDYHLQPSLPLSLRQSQCEGQQRSLQITPLKLLPFPTTSWVPSHPLEYPPLAHAHWSAAATCVPSCPPKYLPSSPRTATQHSHHPTTLHRTHPFDGLLASLPGLVISCWLPH